MIDIERVQELLAAACPHDASEITPDKHLVKDLDIDSFGLMDMVISFEDEFSIEIPDRDLRQFVTVNDIINYLEARITGGAFVAP